MFFGRIYRVLRTVGNSWQGGGLAGLTNSRSWQGGAETSTTDAKSWEGGAKTSTLDAKSWEGGAKTSTLDAKSWQGGAKTTVFDGQSWQGGAKVATLTGGSWQGGAVAGIINPAHTRGYNTGGNAPDLGGNMNAVPLWTPSNCSTIGGPGAGVFVKMPAYTTNGTLLWEVGLGNIGFWRVSITSTGVMKTEFTIQDTNTVTFNSVRLMPSYVFPLNQWVWVTSRIYASCNSNGYHLQTYVTNGTITGSDDWPSGFNISSAFYWGQLGIGVPVHVSTTYDPFPNIAGYEMSKFRYVDRGNPLYSPPTLDPGVGNYGIQYNGREAAGNTILFDTGGQWNATQGNQGLTFVTDGPYP